MMMLLCKSISCFRSIHTVQAYLSCEIEFVSTSMERLCSYRVLTMFTSSYSTRPDLATNQLWLADQERMMPEWNYHSPG